MKKLICFLLFVLVASRLSADNPASSPDSASFYNLSLEQLMNVEVTVASGTALTNRESPGIVTVLTREEIRKTGCNDLMELLQRLPGFDFGVDVEGVVGIGVRGNWGHEGKVLMIVDGHEMNEDNYSTLQFGQHYPTSQISKIEIIRGPGSAIYGGNAEYAVINVQTINSERHNGIHAFAGYGQMKETFSNRYAGISSGSNLGKFHVNLSGIYSDGNRSDLTYTDNFGSSYSMKDNSDLQNTQLRMDVGNGGFVFSAFGDMYHTRQRDGYENALSHSYPTDFNSFYLLSSYELHPSERLSLTPGIRFKFHEPWNYDEASVDGEFPVYDVHSKKSEFYLNSIYDVSRRVQLTGGLNAYHMVGEEHDDTVQFSNGKDIIEYINASAHLQAMIRLGAGTVTIGARYNYNDLFESSFVPRLAYNYVKDTWHLKALYSQAFRTPAIENLNYGGFSQIHPEQTSVIELEAGFQPFPTSYLTVNLYDITTDDLILFYYDSDNADGYRNNGKAGTRGVEMEFRVKRINGYGSLTYAYYTTDGKPVVDAYAVPGKSGSHLGFANHKINVAGNWRINSTINITPSLTVLSERFASRYDEATDTYIAERYRPVGLMDINVNFENVLTNGLTFRVGCFNVLDEPMDYIQPYNANHAPLPGASREFRIRLSYEFQK